MIASRVLGAVTPWYSAVCSVVTTYPLDRNSGSETPPGVTVENRQQVRAVYDKATGRGKLHLVCNDEIETPTAPGTETAGTDLGICNFAAVAYSTAEADLYPGNRLKRDDYYFPKEVAKCDDSGGKRATRLHKKWSEQRAHFCHSAAKRTVERCVARGVGCITVGNFAGVREDENGESKNWGNHGNPELNQRNAGSSAILDENRSAGWLAQPAVYLHDLSSGVQPQEQVVDCKR